MIKGKQCTNHKIITTPAG